MEAMTEMVAFWPPKLSSQQLPNIPQIASFNKLKPALFTRRLEVDRQERLKCEESTLQNSRLSLSDWHSGPLANPRSDLD